MLHITDLLAIFCFIGNFKTDNSCSAWGLAQDVIADLCTNCRISSLTENRIYNVSTTLTCICLSVGMCLYTALTSVSPYLRRLQINTHHLKGSQFPTCQEISRLSRNSVKLFVHLS